MVATTLSTASGAAAFKLPRRSKDGRFFELSRLMVVAIAADSGRLGCRAQTKPNGPWEPDWTVIDKTRTYDLLTAGITGDGRVAAVAQRSGGSGLSYIDEAADAIGVQQWNAPVDLGKPQGVKAFVCLAMAYDVDGRIEIFGADDGGGRIWWKYQNPSRIVQVTKRVTPPGTKTPITVTVDEIEPPATPWSDWIMLPGSLATLEARRMADGRIILFGINAGGDLFRSEQRVAQAVKPGDWTDWVQMNDAAMGPIAAIAPAMDALGAVNLFAVTTRDSQISHARQSPADAPTWTGWATPGFIRPGIQAMAAGIDGDGHVVLIATDTTKLHNMNVQRSVESQQWTGWNPFQHTDYPCQLMLDYNADGRLTLFSHWLLPNTPPFGGLWCISQMALNSTEWETAWTELAPGDIRQWAVVRDLTPPT